MKHLLYLLLLLPLASCYNDKEAVLYPQPLTCDTTNARFSTVVAPICANNCATAGCHDATTHQNGYDLSSYAGVQKSAADGSLVGTTTHASGYDPMPLGGAKLPDCDLAQIKAWVAAGAPNN